MSERLDLNNIKNLRLKKLLLRFNEAITLECKELNIEYNSQSSITKAGRELAKREHELVIYLNNRIEK